jgi:hypothetical protein
MKKISALSVLSALSIIALGGFFYGANVTLAQDVAAKTINARILPSIWYSDLSTEAGNNIDIHAGIQNNSGNNFSGTVSLYVDDVKIGENPFLSETDRLKDVFITWKATAGNHVFQMKITASLPSDQILISYKSDLSYMSVENKKLTFEGVKENIKENIISGASSFISSIVPQTIQKGDQIAVFLATSLEASKEPLIAENVATAKAVTATETAVPANVKEKSSGFTFLSKNQAASVYNTGVDILSFLIKQWKWSLSVLVLVALFIFFKIRSKF